MIVKKRSEGIGQIDDYLSVDNQLAIPTGSVDPTSIVSTDKGGGTTKVPIFFNTTSNELRAFFGGMWQAVSPDLSAYATTDDVETYVTAALGAYYGAGAVDGMFAFLKAASFNLGVDPDGNKNALRETGGTPEEQTAGQLWVGWNMSNSLGEIDFLAMQGSADLTVGGFQFWKINNQVHLDQEDKLLLTLKGDDYTAVFGGRVALGILDDYASSDGQVIIADPTFNILQRRDSADFGQDLNLVIGGTFFYAAMPSTDTITVELPAEQANEVYQVFVQPGSSNSRKCVVQNKTQESFDVFFPDGAISGDTLFDWAIVPNNFFLP
jgi:hypothetical protein